VLLRWRKEVQARGEAAAFTARELSELSEVERLEKRIAELERHHPQGGYPASCPSRTAF
jgi:hypothetical protein